MTLENLTPAASSAVLLAWEWEVARLGHCLSLQNEFFPGGLNEWEFDKSTCSNVSEVTVQENPHETVVSTRTRDPATGALSTW